MQNAIENININDCVVNSNEQNSGVLVESGGSVTTDHNLVSNISHTIVYTCEPSLTQTTHSPINKNIKNNIDIEYNNTTNITTNITSNIHKTNNKDNNNINNNSSSPKLNLMAELFESEEEEEEEDDNSEVESFTLDEEPVLDTSKFLLSAETTDNQIVTGIHLTETPEIDAESRANLEALLEADPDVLRRIASSFAVSDVHCALDEAAAAIAKMRINDSQLSSITPLTNSTNIHKQEQHSKDYIEGYIEGSSHLMEERCNVNEVTEEGESFLSFACSSGHYELAKQLLVARANVEDRGLKDTTPLMEASSAGHLKIVELLLEQNAEVNAQTSQGNTPLMYACAGGHKEVVKLLLEKGANVEDHNENGHTPLMEAASAGHVSVAKILVEHGASINTHSNEFKESALTLACYKGHLEMVRFLLEAGADQEHKTDEMHTALMEASMDGHVEVARLLLDSGAQVNMPADSFESPLTLAACGGHVELAMLLLERGANIEEVNDEGYTPLMEAAREGHEEMVALLLSQGGDINAQTEETQETALTLACCGGFLDVADFLIKAGADIEAGANTPLMEAAQEGHLDLVRHLINCGASVNATTSSGDTALMYACENGHTDVAELLLQAGANLEHEAEGGRTPLMKASRAGHLCTVQFLLNRGANVNKVTTNNDHTPLSLACAGGHLAVVELLLANGTDPTHRLKDNSTMLIEAAKGGHTTVVQLLIDYPTNLMASSPPVDLSQLTTSANDADVAPRVPSHGLQLDDTSNRTHSSITSSIQSKINIQKMTSKKNIPKDNSSMNATNVTNSKGTDSVDSYVPFPKGRSVNKVLERSLSDSGTSFTPTTNANSTESPAFSSIDALKEAERLEARINDMIRRTDELDPAKEEQIRQKQQILEELQRVEREYQAHWQQQLIQCYQAGLSCPSISQVSANLPTETSNISTSVSSHGIPLCLDVSNLQKPFKIGGETQFAIPPPALTQSNLFQPNPTSMTTDITSSINLSVIPTPTSFTSTISSTTNTTISLPTPPVTRRFRSNSKIKNTSKQHSQQSQQQSAVNIPKTSSQSITIEDVEKMNLKNAVNLEQLEQLSNSNTSAVNQQTQNLLQQQQLILSELAQNFSSRPETLQFLQSAASNIKIDSSIPFLLPRLFEPNAMNQTSVIQQTPQLQSQLFQQTQQQTTQINQSINVSMPSITTSQDINKKSLSSKTSKLNKSIKVGNIVNPSQQLTQTVITPQQHLNQMTQTASILQTLTSEQLMLLKNQFAAAASTATQTDAPSALQQISPNLTTSAPTSCLGSSNTAGIYSLGAPAFPVSLTLSPVTISPASTTVSNRTAIISTIIPYPVDSEDNNSQFVVSNPSNLVDFSSVSSVSVPQISHSITTSCMDSSNLLSSGPLSTMFTNTMTPTSGFEPLSFPTVSNVLTASLPQSANANLSSLTSHMSYTLPNTLDSLSGNTFISNSQDSDITTTTTKSEISVPASLTTTTSHSTNIRIPSPPPWYPPLDLDSQTDSNHDTALTLACAGGHEELVSLLLNRGAEMEHRDKKGFTPLMLASTAGHANVVEIMLNNGADMEAQSERTKDTALSLACSSGRYEVVEILLSRGANKEHRNVSDYTPLSLAASGGYVNIIKLLLSHGAEINSRTGSKLGISPLMLAAMNGHAATVRLLLDMGSDINAQIETNRNTALTLACFQGRCEVVGLLLDRKANVEHRAKTGLTPLMEAASGGYVEVGRVLLDKCADVNAPPVPSSRDTGLTIAADKGHYRFVELLLSRGAAVDVKNKKGNSPLWLACNGGHLDVVQLLVSAGCDIDSQDNRKVSCLMAAFRKGHVKVVKWMVKHVNQFPSDQEITRFIALINDKELLKKTNQCAEILRQAKERQAAEANKNATILLEEIDLERSREESRKAAAARRRERKRRKKKEKQEQIKASKTSIDEKENKSDGYSRSSNKSKESLNKLYDDDEDDDDDDYLDNDDSDEDEDEVIDITPSPIREPLVQPQKETKLKTNQPSIKVPFDQTFSNKQKDMENKLKKVNTIQNVSNSLLLNNAKKTTNQQHMNALNFKGKKKEEIISSNVNVIHDTPLVITGHSNKLTSESHSSHINSNFQAMSQRCVSSSKTTIDREQIISNKSTPDIFSELTVEMPKDLNGNSSNCTRSPSYFTPIVAKGVASFSSITSNNNQSISSIQSKKGQKREEGWKEVVRKSKKVVVPSNAISRVIGRGGCNINTIREISGAHIEVEKQKGQGDRMVIIKGSADATRHAQQLIAALSKETEKDLSEIIRSLGLSRPTSVSSEEMAAIRTPCKSSSTAVMNLTSRQPISAANVLKSSSMSAVTSSGFTSSVNAFTNRSALFVRPSVPLNSSPFVNNISAWNTKASASPRMPSISLVSVTSHTYPVNTTKSTVSYTMAVAAKGRNTKTTSVSNIVPAISKVISSTEMKTTSVSIPAQLRSTGAPHGVQPFNQMFAGARVPVPINTTNGSKTTSYLPTGKQPFSSVPTVTSTQSTLTCNPTISETNNKDSSSSGLNGTTPEYTPFNNLFSKVAQSSVWAQSKDSSQKPNFASVAASGLTSVATSNAVHSNSLTSTLMLPIPQNSEQEVAIDVSKAPGYRGNLHISPSNNSLASTPSSTCGTSNLGPIGSGHARSAPCTPPLIPSQGPHTPNSSVKMSSPPLSGTPTPPPQHSLLHQNRSIIDSQNPVFSMTNIANDSNISGSLMNSSHSPLSVTSIVNSTSVVTSYQTIMPSNLNNSPNIQSIVSNSLKNASYNMSAINMQRHYGTNTTYSQNTPLTSVGPMQSCNEQNPSVFGVNSNTVQSNLNPNAPDFSARGSVIQSSHHMNGPSMTQQNRINSNSGINSSNPSQAAAIVLQDQMRAAILAASANLQLQTLQKQQAARMHYAANPALHQNHLAANDFGTNTPPPSPETLRLLHTAINSIPNANSPHGLQHFGLMQPSNYMTQNIQQQQQQQHQQQQHQQQQQQQLQNQRVSQNSLNTMNSPKEMDSNSDYEERKLPRPIGTERAQRKHPTPVFAQNNMNALTNNISATNDTTQGMWPFGCADGMAGNEMNEWMQHQQQQQQQIHSSNISSDNQMANIHQTRYNTGEDVSHFDSTYQMSVGSHVGNALNYSSSTLPMMGINGVPPHLSSTLYQSISTPGLSSAQDCDYWSSKIPTLSNTNTGNGMSGNQSANTEQKINWNNWNQHT